MPKTTKPKPKPKRAATKGDFAGADPLTAALEQRKALKARIRVEKEIVKLGDALLRAMRRTDYRMSELGAGILQRAARLNQLEAQRDMDRERAIHERLPQPAE